MLYILKILLLVLVVTLSLEAKVQKVQETYIIISTAGTTYVGNALDQTYSLNPNSVSSSRAIVISDLSSCSINNIWEQRDNFNPAYCPTVQADGSIFLPFAPWTNGRLGSDGYYDANAMITKNTYNILGKKVRTKFSLNGADKYLASNIGVTNLVATLPRKHLSTHNIWASSTLVDDNRAIYQELKINMDGTYTLNLSYNGYGQSDIYTAAGELTTTQKASAADSYIYFNSGDNYGGIQASATLYELDIIDMNTNSSGDIITIIDQGGSNYIELVGGLTIISSLVAHNEIVLYFNDGAIVNIRGADTFTYNVGANQAEAIIGAKQDFETFVINTLGLSSVPTGGDVVAGDTTILQEIDQDIDTVRIAFPSLDMINGVVIQENVSPPPLPGDNFSLDGKVYEVTVPDSTPLPAKVSLPVSQELLSEANNKQVVVGRYNGESWDIIPATIIDKFVVAEVDHFSNIGVFWRLTQDISEYTKEELESFTVNPPKFDWIKIENNEITAVLNLSYSRFINGNTGKTIPLHVEKWELLVLTPHVDLGRPHTSRGTYEPLLVNGERYIHIPFDVYTAKVDVNLSNLFDFSTIMDKLDGFSNSSSYGNFAFKLRPIFNDENNTKGTLSSFTLLPIGVADTQIRLTKGLSSRLSTTQREAFIARVSSTPYLLIYDKGWNEAYGTPLSLSNFIYLSSRGIYQPIIGIKKDSSWGRVVTHEWGHYASHMLLGDEWSKNASAGAHIGWKEADSRELAWSEDIATFLGQWGVKDLENELENDDDSITLPLKSGAMAGNLSNHSKTVAEIAGGVVEDYWPINKNMDAIKVEAVSASILSRLSSRYPFEKVMEVILSSKATTLVEFINEWFKHYKMDSSESLFLQNLCIDEGVKWIVHGKVIDSDSAVLNGVTAIVEGMNGTLISTAVSDDKGNFNITIPPGNVKIKLEYSGYTSLDDREITYTQMMATNHASSGVKLFIGKSGEVSSYSGDAANAFRMSKDEGYNPSLVAPRYCPQYNPIDYFYHQILISGVDSEGNAYDKIACNYFTGDGINEEGGLHLQYETPYTREGELPHIFEKRNGNSWTWYESGEFKRSIPYRDGKLDGVKKEYNPIGNLIKETPYVQGLLHGVMKEYYEYPSFYLNGNEKISVETTYSDGEKDGETRFYNRQGVMTSCYIYESGTYSSIGSCMP